jgi:hypothetical protein
MYYVVFNELYLNKNIKIRYNQAQNLKLYIMKFKHSGILSLVFLFGIGILQLQSQSYSLNIKRWDSTENNIELSTIKKITFLGTDFIINYQKGSTENYATSSVRKIVFGSYSGLKETLSETNPLQIFPNPSGDFITLKNQPEGVANLSIYSICGTQIMNLQHYSCNVPIDISWLTKGIYIIKVNNQALKFTKL